MLPDMSSVRWIIARCIGSIIRLTGIEIRKPTPAPMTPANRPTSAPSAGEIGWVWFCCSRYAATAPPATTHRQQHRLPRLTSGSDDSTPITRPPISAGWPMPARVLVVVFASKVRDQLLTLQIPKRVFQLHQLNEQIVFRIQIRSVHRALEVEREPFLNTMHPRPLRQIHEQRDVEDDRRRENTVATQEIDLQLHRVTKPPDQIDVVPAFFVVAARRIVIDAHDVAE